MDDIVENSEKKTEESETFGKKNVIIFSVGFVMLIIGFFILSYTDNRGQNLASVISPIVLVGSYITMGIGLIIK